MRQASPQDIVWPAEMGVEDARRLALPGFDGSFLVTLQVHAVPRRLLCGGWGPSGEQVRVEEGAWAH